MPQGGAQPCCAADQLMLGASLDLHEPDLLILDGTAAVQGNISSWKKKEGESFGPGDVLAEIETDKVPACMDAL